MGGVEYRQQQKVFEIAKPCNKKAKYGNDIITEIG